ncbi:hypothetical protein O0I10_005922 [Lichtheimia ornata]|uniref:Major facilitator superfamily (MFS) profile domain-containing protein n=1 Tax=Lichtheimia ornata TaxID=688661 RepID=A0AAD7V3Q1_9FUNG|nr:uncharacterized protein O0I10_005922 [Lichtheimia ornata]KAJ8658240.1 hypothetical protein O0I10_005922 [Lichtheimia ornata]
MTRQRAIVTTVITALLIDLLAFTIILPLFPRLLNYYREQESDEGTLLSYALQVMEHYKDWITASKNDRGDKWDTVLLGGLLGSMFSLLQFFVSPMIGRASDRMGRRRVLLLTMVGNLLSSAMWIFAQSFSMFLLARIVAGLSEGNVQLSIAIISDVTEPEKRSRHLALVGITFAVAFTLGPAIGAWFASVDLSQLHPIAAERLGIYPYSTPALVALVLLLIETVYIYFKLPETINVHSNTSKDSDETSTQPVSDALDIDTRLANLRRLKWIHGLHLFLFSGMEFTLVFLTFDVLDYTNMQQGKLLAYMGILSALLQGGYVRRRVQKLGEKALVLQGMVSCTIGLVCLGVMSSSSMSTTSSVRWLYAGVSCLALTTGTVVNCLTGLASLQCQDDKAKDTHPLLAKGRALGEFRSSGQLGRALGPISACGLYWIAGPQRCYAAAAFGMGLITILTAAAAPTTKHTTKAKNE